MKKHLLIISAAMLIVLTALVAVACGGSNDDKNNGNPSNPTTNNLIVGSWKVVDGKDFDIYTFNANQQGVVSSYSDYYKETNNTPISWSYNDNTKRLIIIFVDDEYGNVVLTYEVIWFGNDQFYLKPLDGYEGVLSGIYGELIGAFNRQ